ncbi:helix-turn-helix domain-containing protein [Priestia megaterium]
MSNEQVEDFSRLDEIANKETGRKIKSLAQNRSISQTQLAKMLNKDAKTISNYYCGKSLPDKKDLILLSRLLAVPPDEILVFRGDVEGFQRISHFYFEYDEDTETIYDAINKSKIESKLFNSWSKGRANIRNLEEAGLCLNFFSSLAELNIRNRIMDALFSGNGINNSYMHHIYEDYIWRELSEEQKDLCKTFFAYWRGESKEAPSYSKLFELVEKELKNEPKLHTSGYLNL